MSKLSRQISGFTIVEMLIIAPIVLLAIGAFITAIVSMTGDVLASRSSNALAYSIQDALARIESDVKLSTSFLAKNTDFTDVNDGVTVVSPQGYNNDTTAFTNIGASGNMLILNALATVGNPLDASNSIVYLADKPNACTSSAVGSNKPMSINIVYFVKDSTLWRRTIMPSDYATSGIACNDAWQQPSCYPTFMTDNPGSIAFCKTQDQKLIEDIEPTDIDFQYYSSASATTANSVAVTSIDDDTRYTAMQSTTTLTASINIVKTAAGREINQSGSIRATRLDVNASSIATVVPDVIPAAPVPTGSIASATPTTVNFTWPTVLGATTYTLNYTLDAGGANQYVSGLTNSTSTSYSVTSGHGKIVCVTVYANSPAGTSPLGSKCVTIPLWAPMILQNNWSNYGGAYTPAQYTKTSEGVIVLSGLIKRSGAVVAGEVLFQLPANYRPNLRQIYTTMTNSNVASRIDVDSDGSVRIQGGDAGYLSLDGVKFIPSATTSISFQALSLTNSWVNYDAATHQVASYAKDNLNRTFTRGLIKSGSTTAASLIASLPSSPNYQSPSYLHIPNYNSGGYGFFSPSQTNATYPGAGLQYKGGSNAYYSIESMFYNSYTGWINLSMANSWTWYDAAGIFSTPQYVKASDGIVSLKGLIRSGITTAETTIANLPAGYRPKARLIFEVINNGGVGRVDVLPTGVVNIQTGGNVWLALDSINFIAEQ